MHSRQCHFEDENLIKAPFHLFVVLQQSLLGLGRRGRRHGVSFAARWITNHATAAEHCEVQNDKVSDNKTQQAFIALSS